MRRPWRSLGLAMTAGLLLTATAHAQFYPRSDYGWRRTGWGYGPAYGSSVSFRGPVVSGFGRVGPLLPFGGYSSFGYSSFGGFGGLSYYNGPVGSVGWPYGFGYGYGYNGWGLGPYTGPYGFTTFGPNFAPWAGYFPAPTIVQTAPIFYGPDLSDNPVIQEWMPHNQQQQPAGAGRAAPDQPPQDDVRIFVKPTTLEAKRKSIRYQAQGDEWFRKQNYLQAFARYKQAYTAAQDRPEPRFRMAVALAALTEYDQAVDELKRLTQVVPDWPARGERLDELFGAERNLSKNMVLNKVAAWVKEDIRDADRLFLFAVLLHFNEDVDKAQTVFQTASILANRPAHVEIFLNGGAPADGPLPAEEAELPADPAADEAPAPRPEVRQGPAAPVPPAPDRELSGPRLGRAGGAVGGRRNAF